MEQFRWSIPRLHHHATGHKALLWLQPKLCTHPHHYSAPQLITIILTPVLARNYLRTLQALTDINEIAALSVSHQSVAYPRGFVSGARRYEYEFQLNDRFAKTQVTSWDSAKHVPTMKLSGPTNKS